MSYYDSEEDSSSEVESSYSSDEWYKSASYESDKVQRFLKHHVDTHKPEPIRNVERFQWYLFYTYGYRYYAGYHKECHEKVQFGWEKAFDLVSRFLQHETGCNIKNFLSLKHPFGHDSAHDDTECLQYAKDGNSRIHIHKKFHDRDSDDDAYGTPFFNKHGLTAIIVNVNKDLNFRAVIISSHGRHTIVLTEKRVPIFKRQMRLRRSILGERMDSSWLYFAQDCHFARESFKNWRDERRACRKFQHMSASEYKKKSNPPAYAKCKNSARHKKSVLRNRSLPQKEKQQKSINKNILKNAVKSIQKKVEQKPQENNNEEKQKLAPIGDRLGPDH